jgi:hypothetical protein
MPLFSHCRCQWHSANFAIAAAILNINRMIEEAEKMQAEGGFDGGSQTDVYSFKHPL